MVTIIALLFFVVVVEGIFLSQSRDEARFYRGMYRREERHAQKLYEALTGIPANVTHAPIDWNDDVIGD